MTTPEGKTCTKCNVHKNLDEYGKRGLSKDGLSYWCKPCESLHRAEYYKKNKISMREKMAIYQKTPEGRASQKRASKKYRNTPEGKMKERVRGQVCIALSNGSLTKLDHCEDCGNNKCEVEAHHPDYSKPLDVVWLCKQCHEDEHVRLSAIESSSNYEKT